MAKKFTVTVMGSEGADTTPLAAFVVQILRAQNIISAMSGKEDGELLAKMSGDDYTIAKALREIAASQAGPIETQIQVEVVDSPTSLMPTDAADEEE